MLASDCIIFGPYSVFPKERLLERNGVAVPIGDRALDILLALLKRGGEVVDKWELIAAVWPDVTVAEGSLRFHVAGLRRVLRDGEGGARYVVNIKGRGYSFVAPVRQAPVSEDAAARAVSPRAPEPAEDPQAPGVSSAPAPTEVGSRLPARQIRIIGRDAEAAAICRRLVSERFVTVVGPGGIGKTTLALLVGRTLEPQFADGAWFLDFSVCKDPLMIPLVIAAAIGLTLRTAEVVTEIVRQLSSRNALLIFDNCEHLIDDLAPICEIIAQECVGVHILATSREALMVIGESIYRLATLSYPVGERPSHSQLRSYSAVQLFLERASAAGCPLELNDGSADLVALICRKLDGVALAIELAACRVGAYGLHETAALLDGRMRLLWSGRRTAPARQRTLSATVDWSYQLLSEVERFVLCRLSVFPGAFGLEAAQAVAAGVEVSRLDVVAAVDGLFSKSLLVSEGEGADVRYRLLEVTRDYAAVRLAEFGETRDCARKHAVYYESFLVRRAATPRAQRGALSREVLDNVRAALGWAFSEEGDGRLAASLASASLPMFFEFSLLVECQTWAVRAIDVIEGMEICKLLEMNLHAFLGLSLMFTQGNGSLVRVSLERAMHLAEMRGGVWDRLRILGGLNIYFTRIGDFRQAVATARRSLTLAEESQDEAAATISRWMLGTSFHLLGSQADARDYCGMALDAAPLAQRIQASEFGFDHRIRALVALGRALWLRGLADQALRVAHRTLREARLLDPVTRAISLIWTVSVFMWYGDLERAGEITEQLIAHASESALLPYRAVGRGFQGELMMRRGEAAEGIEAVREAVGMLDAGHHQILTTVFVTSISRGLASLGEFGQACDEIDRAIASVGDCGSVFDGPELLRMKAGLTALSSDKMDLEAEKLLLRSLHLARQQSALSWELRSAVTLATLWARGGRHDAAREILAPVLTQFTEGGGSSDLKSANRILTELSDRRTACWESHLRAQVLFT